MVGNSELSLMDDEWVSFVINNGEMEAGPHIVNGKCPLCWVEVGLYEVCGKQSALTSIHHKLTSVNNTEIWAGGEIFSRPCYRLYSFFVCCKRYCGLKKNFQSWILDYSQPLLANNVLIITWYWGNRCPIICFLRIKKKYKYNKRIVTFLY